MHTKITKGDMNTITKLAHIAIIVLILSAFIVAPVVASAENDEFANTRTETRTQSDEEINAIFEKAFKKWGVELCQMYRKIHGDDGVDYILFDDVNPHPFWENLVKNGDTLRIIPGTEPGERYALVYPPKNTKEESSWILPGAKAVIPAGFAIGYVVVEITPEIIVYATGIMTAAGFVNINAENFNEALNELMHDLNLDARIALMRALDTIGIHQYYRLDGKYIHRKNSELSFDEALKLMKDCKKPNKDVKDDNIWIGSTEDGCKILAEATTKALGGITPEYSPGSHNQPPHYHATSPYIEHCPPHCFWDYKDFFKKRGRVSEL